jgi:hypothetical protein
LADAGGVDPSSGGRTRRLPRTEAERVRFHENEDRVVNCSVNRVYRTIKFDQMRLTSGRPDRGSRERLDRKVAEDVSAAQRQGERLTLEIDAGTVAPAPGGCQIGRTLVYQYGPG